MGDANQDQIVDLGEKHGVKVIEAHHEGNALGMADGYARFSGKVGLATVTQGPGYTNATTSLVCARLHRTPLLLAGHASLRDPYNPQGMVDQHELAKLTTEATVKMDDPLPEDPGERKENHPGRQSSGRVRLVCPRRCWPGRRREASREQLVGATERCKTA
jgi:thiamine pyrophosphate-dependent acetolactate synthase large subunit-like protein